MRSGGDAAGLARTRVGKRHSAKSAALNAQLTVNRRSSRSPVGERRVVQASAEGIAWRRSRTRKRRRRATDDAAPSRRREKGGQEEARLIAGRGSRRARPRRRRLRLPPRRQARRRGQGGGGEEARRLHRDARDDREPRAGIGQDRARLLRFKVVARGQGSEGDPRHPAAAAARRGQPSRSMCANCAPAISKDRSGSTGCARSCCVASTSRCIRRRSTRCSSRTSWSSKGGGQVATRGREQRRSGRRLGHRACRAERAEAGCRSRRRRGRRGRRRFLADEWGAALAEQGATGKADGHGGRMGDHDRRGGQTTTSPISPAPTAS